MALNATAVIEIEFGGSDSLNGGLYDPGTSGVTRDAALAAIWPSAGTYQANNPVVRSANDTAVAGDVGNVLHVVSGTNWLTGYYPIAALGAFSATISAGGSGYTVGDILTVSGGSNQGAAQFKVASLGASNAVATLTAVATFCNPGNYSITPTNAASTTGGTGSGCTLTITWGWLLSAAAGNGSSSGSVLSLPGTLCATVVNGGSSYAVGDTISLNGGTTSGNNPTAVLIVLAVSSGAVTKVGVSNRGFYLSVPSNPVSQASSSGSGTGATFNVNWMASSQSRTLNYGEQIQAGCVTSSYTVNTASGTWSIDFSQNNSPISLTGLTTSAANAIILTTAARKAHVANGLQVTGGTLFLTGYYEVKAATAGTSLTVDRNVTSGTGAAGTAGMGGAFATWNGAVAALNAQGVIGMQAFMQGGTNYTLAASSTVLTLALLRLTGYAVSRKDFGFAHMQATAGSVTLISGTTGMLFIGDGLILDGNSESSSSAISFTSGTIELSNCQLNGFTGTVLGGGFAAADLYYISASSNSGTIIGPTSICSVTLTNCFANNNSGSIYIAATNTASNSLSMFGVIIGNQQTSVALKIPAQGTVILTNVSFHGASGSNPANFITTTTANSTDYHIHLFQNCIFENCSGAARADTTETYRNEYMVNCAFYNVGSQSSNPTTQIINPIALSGDAFNGAAVGDFSPNNTAGAGLACQAAGIPGVMPGGLSQGFADIGALQHQASGGGGGGASVIGSSVIQALEGIQAE